MPAARGVKRSASKSSASTSASSAPQSKKKRGVTQLEIPSLPTKCGRVMTCGQGDVGQLGLGEDVQETTKFKYVKGLGDNVVAICAGGMHTVALDSDGKVWTWGCNDEGALGRAAAGDAAEGAAGRVSLPAVAVAVSAGDSHSAALLSDGRVYAWGSFRDSHGSMGLVARGREGKPSKEPVALALADSAVAIASGSDHLLVLTASGAIYTLGCGEQGQLGRLSQRSASRDARQGVGALLTPARVALKGGAKRVWAGYHASFALDSAERLLAWGLNNYGQLGVSGEKRKGCVFTPTECDAFSSISGPWSQLAPGQHHSLAIDHTGQLYAIGRCEYGRLGLGASSGDAEKPAPVLSGKKVRCAAAGTACSYAVTEEGETYAWGMGSEGQLGTGASADCDTPQLLTTPTTTSMAAGGQHAVLLTDEPPAPKAEPEAAPPEKIPKATKKDEEAEAEAEADSQMEEEAKAEDATEKVNGKEKKEPESEMEVDETDNTAKDTQQTTTTTTTTDTEKPEPATTENENQQPEASEETTKAKSEETKMEEDTSEVSEANEAKEPVQEPQDNDVPMEEPKPDVNGDPQPIEEPKVAEKVEKVAEKVEKVAEKVVEKVAEKEEVATA